MEYSWKISRFADGDEDGIYKLKSMISPGTDKGEWRREWNWWYRENPLLKGNPWIFLAKDAGEIVGHYAATPFLLKFGDRVIQSFLGISAMTHSEYRGQRIYQTLLKTFQESAMAELGYYVINGFPNHLSFAITVEKMGRQPISRIRGLQKPLDWKRYLDDRIPYRNRLLKAAVRNIGSIAGPLYYRSTSYKQEQGVAVVQVQGFDERINSLWESVSGNINLLPVKNEEYLNWRYVKHPNKKYTILLAEKGDSVSGYLVLNLNKRSDEYIIVDLLAENDSIVIRLLERAEELANAAGKALFSYFVAGRNIYQNAFKQFGFIFLPENRGNWFTIFVSPQITEEDKMELVKKDNWYIQLGDSDIY